MTQGYRLSTGRTGNVGPDIIYPKGAYILHMLRMMMRVPKEGDARFKTMCVPRCWKHRSRASTSDRSPSSACT